MGPLEIISAIFVLGALIFVHELGHFLFAKWHNVGVLTFAIGFGPTICKFRRGETLYKICAIPLGGFVRMVGDMPDSLTGAQATDGAVRRGEVKGEEFELEQEDSQPDEVKKAIADRNRWFIEKNLFERSSIVVAGPLFNFVFAFFLIALSIKLFGEEKVGEQSIIGQVMKGSPAEVVGLLPGDRVLSINNKPIENWKELAGTILEGTGEDLNIKFNRANEISTLRVTPKKQELKTLDGAKTVYMIGIQPETSRVDASLVRSIRLATNWTINVTLMTYDGMWGMLTGRLSPKDIAGPIFIVGEAGKQAKKGLENFFSFMALLSVSLAALNLLPIPMLDGGHLLFFFIESAIGPISTRKKELAQQIGMLALLCLMGFAIHNDIFREDAETSGELKWSKSADEDLPQLKPAK